MKLSIITCTYNSEKYLQNNIDSVILQNLDPKIYEHIFIDWFSTDKTVDIINDYKNKYWKRYNIVIYQSKAKGIYNAMNEWIKISKWEYINFLNSDDYFIDDVLWDYLEYIEHTWKLDFYYWINRMVDSGWKFLYEYPNRWIYKRWLRKYILLLACYVFQSNSIYKRNLHAKYWYYNENLELVSDFEFFVNITNKKISNKFYNKLITNFRIHWTSSSNDLTKQDEERNQVVSKYYNFVLSFLIKLLYKSYRKINK
jgi:glycosyltransferase involved in cell wall biosynthesis